MKQSRRQFMQVSAAAGAGLLFAAKVARATQSPALRKFVQPLPGLGPAGIPVASANTTAFPGSDYYRLVAGEYSQQLHPDLPKATKLWGYADETFGAPAYRHLGPVVVARRGRPVRIQLRNNLPSTHLLPIDMSVTGADLGADRISMHLHGGQTPWISDGGPFAWFNRAGNTGQSYMPVPDMPVPPLGSMTYFYPNDQSARLEWYHDHAVGITRLNAYAGLASVYLLQDDVEAGMVASGMIPARQIPIVVQDKKFKTEPDAWGVPGDLWYPSEADALGAPLPSCVPEFFGDTMLVNGVVYPTAAVEPRRYRLRILNACNARVLALRVAPAKGKMFPADAEPRLNFGPGAWPIPLIQIGTEGGFLPDTPATRGGVALGYDQGTALVLAPGERADVIVDFTGVAGGTFILYSQAPAPYPTGDPLDDYFPNNPNNPVVTQPGYGPNTRTLLQFKVGSLVGSPDPKKWQIKLPPMDPPPLIPPGSQQIPAGVPVRDLTLNEDVDSYGRLIQMLGTKVKLTPVSATYGRSYDDPPTETPAAGSVEVWRIFNLTADTHPIHFHLVNVQLVQRQAFRVGLFTRTGRVEFTSQGWGPAPNELGWKETVQMHPGECTTVIMKFDLPVAPFVVPASPRTGGNEYVWHCHILEHEEHDMMRPLIVT